MTPDTTTALVNNYVKALDMRRKAHEMGALFGGRLPHPPAYLPGGFTTQPNAVRISKFKSYLAELIPFIQNTYIKDVQALGLVYHDYYTIGSGHGNLLAFGVFDLDSLGNNKLLASGRVVKGSNSVQPVDVTKITEQVTYSWYATSSNNLNPAVGVTTPVDPTQKPKAYSWLKAPRYQNEPYETGPLARMVVNGDYNKSISVMDRHLARAQEALKVAQAMNQWVNQLQVGQPVYKTWNAPASASAIGLTEAPRGALGHWLQITGSKIARYQVITPTCWNASPRDAKNVRGPIEEALIGTPVSDPDQPVEVLRVIHSYDPCLSCAVHVMRPQGDKKIFVTGSPAGGASL